MQYLRRTLAPYLALPRSVHVLFFAALVNYLGNFVAPFLTMYLTFARGMDAAQVGALVASNAGLGMLGAMIGGKLMDTYSRKSVLLIFRSLAAMAYVMCAFVDSLPAIIGLLLFSTFAGGFSEPVYQTIMTDVTPPESRKNAFSLHYIAINLGFSVATLLAGALFREHMNWLFLGDAVTTFLSIGLVMAFVPESHPLRTGRRGLGRVDGQSRPEAGSTASVAHASGEAAETGGVFAALLKRPALLWFSFITFIYCLVFSQFNFGLSLTTGEAFGQNGAMIYATLITVNAVMCSVLTMFVTNALARFTPAFNLIIGGLLYLVGFGMLGFVNGMFWFVLSTVIWTIGEIVVTTNMSVYLTAHTPITHRGRFNAVFPVIRRMGFIIGPMACGLIARTSGPRMIWPFVAVCALIGSALMTGLHLREQRRRDAVSGQTNRMAVPPLADQ